MVGIRGTKLLSRRLLAAANNVNVPTGSTWVWHGSALDSTGGNMVAKYDTIGQQWYCMVDIAGVTRWDQSLQENRQWQRGRTLDAGGNFDARLGKGAAISANGTVAWSLAGTDTGSGAGGGVHKRTIGGGAWQLVTETYYGDVEGTIGLGRRPVGHRRIYQHPNGTAVFIACQSQGQADRGGIARSTDGSTLHDFDPANTFTPGRMFRALVGSENSFTDVLYVCSDSSASESAPGTGGPCVAIYTNILSGGPVFTRIDTVGTGNPGGLTDCMSMICVDEGGSDVLYIVVGENDTNGGVWRCVITGDPSSGGWIAGAATLSWTKINGGTLAAGHEYRTITGQRVGAATYLMVGSNGSPPNAGGTNPVTGTSYKSMIYRTLNGHVANPTWEPVTASSNMSPGNVFRPVYGTANETWVSLTSIQSANTVNSVPGCTGWTPYDMDIDPVNQTVVVAGKAASWICENPWASTAGNVAWQMFSNSSGAVINEHVAIHPSDNLKWTMSDVDRSGYYSWSGGLAQMKGIETPVGGAAPPCHANYIRQGGSQPGRWLLGDDTGSIRVSDDWDTAATPTFTVDSTGGAALCGVAEVSYGGNDYRLSVHTDGELRVSINGGAWSTKYTFTSGVGPATIIANDSASDFWVMMPGDGLFYFPDITNITAGSTVQTFTGPSGVDTDTCGRVAQSTINRTTLYVTWGDALSGVWRLTGANNLTVSAAGAKTGGTGTVSRMSGGALLTTSKCGPIATDQSVVSGVDKIVVLIPGYSSNPDALYYDGAAWTSIGGSAYAEMGMLPVFVAMSGDRIYTSQFNSGTPFAVLV